jgi:ribosomal protein L15
MTTLGRGVFHDDGRDGGLGKAGHGPREQKGQVVPGRAEQFRQIVSIPPQADGQRKSEPPDFFEQHDLAALEFPGDAGQLMNRVDLAFHDGQTPGFRQFPQTLLKVHTSSPVEDWIHPI